MFVWPCLLFFDIYRICCGQVIYLICYIIQLSCWPLPVPCHFFTFYGGTIFSSRYSSYVASFGKDLWYGVVGWVLIWGCKIVIVIIGPPVFTCKENVFFTKINLPPFLLLQAEPRGSGLSGSWGQKVGSNFVLRTVLPTHDPLSNCKTKCVKIQIEVPSNDHSGFH